MPSKVFSKGDMMDNLPQKTSMGGGGTADSYRGPSAGDIKAYYKGFNEGVRKVEDDIFRGQSKVGKAAIPAIAATIGYTGYNMVKATKAASEMENKKSRMEYAKKAKMADKPPKINLRKAYEE